MKSNKVYFTIIAFVAFFLAGCDKMNDLHEGYLMEGEKIYAAKIDSVSPGPGNERVNMELFVKSQRIDFVRIYWNVYKDSIDYPVKNQTGTFNVMIDKLPEREYLFQFVSFDKFGNRSLPYEVASLVYGENYRSTLSNRHIESIKKTVDGKAIIKWAVVAEDAESTTLTYTDVNGVKAIRTILAAVSADTIPSFKPASEFTFITTYRPATNSPDSFNSDVATRVFPE